VTGVLSVDDLVARTLAEYCDGKGAERC
jgi:hypothetical protein